MSLADTKAAIEKLLEKDLCVFLKIRTQLHSLMIFWERIIHEKNRFDAEDKFRDSASGQVAKRKASRAKPHESDLEAVDQEPPKKTKRMKMQQGGNDDQDNDDSEEDDDSDGDFENELETTDEEPPRGRTRNRGARQNKSPAVQKGKQLKKKSAAGRGGGQNANTKGKVEDLGSEDEQYKTRLAKLLRK
ncbi:hypothetical protein M406DRAFT_326800 [Cryphonectria parasitica EP155]|uniref:Uncharacterized protein n=1 Tax=Cryphonectria parasitica (strain ATCC 38755 / EP155) TaxID=660469 RepID=A0A9P4Y7K7_CRYP1|nr:uncharacterized protein M406DRAFT_326800 [Cryphonectria parasitica EP155]KAF3768193.1 hypothetical protein M406DRAFT_326800 [Cryphonectria parasitica EP155]